MSGADDLRARIEGLSPRGTIKGRLQRACLALVYEHERSGELPTSIRFIFYELEQRRVAREERSGGR